MVAPGRPMGPRSIRSASPAPPLINLPETSPLQIHRKSKPTLSPPPLLIPSKAASPKPVIHVSIPAPNPSDNTSGDSPVFDYYGGGPRLSINTTKDADDMTTIHPSLDTTRPPITHKPSQPIDEVRELLGDLKIRTAPDDDDAIHALQRSPLLDYSDDDLEETGRLGEGAGGAVHKVRDKRNGKVMARKTITTREAPMKQLLRELLIISSTKHVNIILFHGAYMSPSSSEVKILMEFCEGGSLEAVGKRIKERCAVVGEKIAGRIAEGVCLAVTLHTVANPRSSGFTRIGIPSHQEDHTS